jgi:hypothetical protein
VIPKTHITHCFSEKNRVGPFGASRNWFICADWYYIGPILVCTKIKLKNRFMSTTSPTSLAAVVSLAVERDAASAFSREAANKSGGKPEAVAVPGIRPRESRTVNDVLAAEGVGKFPHGNVSEALQRVSGASISRELDEGECVSIFEPATRLFNTLITGRAASYLIGYIRQDSVFPI